MAEIVRAEKVLVTGASGFVGRYVVRELISRGYTAVCVVRDAGKLRRVVPDAPSNQLVAVKGDLFDREALVKAASQCQAAIHLVGIILERRMEGQTFERIHVQGTRSVVDACKQGGVRRYVHMSALGARGDGPSEYQRTKWAAEEIVRNSAPAWTIFRPSIIHGADGEFMELMKTFVTWRPVMMAGIIPQQLPVIPYFGTGENKLQPVSVRDVAACFVSALTMPETVGQVFELGGPKAYSWKELYQTCREVIPGKCKCKPIVSLPLPAARFLAATVMKTPLVPVALKFNSGQIAMSQEDSVCDTAPVEKAFGLKLREFRFEMGQYADQIR